MFERTFTEDPTMDLWISEVDIYGKYVDMGDGVVVGVGPMTYTVQNKTDAEFPMNTVGSVESHEEWWPRVWAFRVVDCEVHEIGRPVTIEETDRAVSGQGICKVDADHFFIINSSADATLSVPVSPGTIDTSPFVYAGTAYVGRVNRTDLSIELGERVVFQNAYFYSANHGINQEKCAGLATDWNDSTIGACTIREDLVVGTYPFMEYKIPTGQNPGGTSDLPGTGKVFIYPTDWDDVANAEQIHLRAHPFVVDRPNLTCEPLTPVRISPRMNEDEQLSNFHYCDMPKRLTDSRGANVYALEYTNGYSAVWDHDESGEIVGVNYQLFAPDVPYWPDGALPAYEHAEGDGNGFDTEIYWGFLIPAWDAISENMGVAYGSDGYFFVTPAYVLRFNEDRTTTILDKRVATFYDVYNSCLKVWEDELTIEVFLGSYNGLGIQQWDRPEGYSQSNRGYAGWRTALMTINKSDGQIVGIEPLAGGTSASSLFLGGNAFGPGTGIYSTAEQDEFIASWSRFMIKSDNQAFIMEDGRVMITSDMSFGIVDPHCRNSFPPLGYKTTPQRGLFQGRDLTYFEILNVVEEEPELVDVDQRTKVTRMKW